MNRRRRGRKCQVEAKSVKSQRSCRGRKVVQAKAETIVGPVSVSNSSKSNISPTVCERIKKQIQ